MTKISGFNVWDTHFHCGRWWVDTRNAGSYFPVVQHDKFALRNFLAQDTVEILTRNPVTESDTLERVFVSNLDCLTREKPSEGNFLKGEYEGNAELINKYKESKNVSCYAVCQPKEGDVKNIEKLFKDFPDKFVGLKFHPKALGLPANSLEYEAYLSFAQKNKLPCLFHSGVAIEWKSNGPRLFIDSVNWEPSDPRFIYELAKKYPKVPVILGHTGAGGAPAHKVAINVLFESLDRNDANLFAEISWMDFTPNGKPSENPKNLIALIRGLKDRNALDRVLFGTDAPLGCYGETAKNSVEVIDSYAATINNIKKAIKTNFPDEADEILDKIFNKNAKKLFNINDSIKDVTQVVATQVEKIKSSKAAFVVLGVLGLIGSFLVVTKVKNKNKN